eukprot:scpid23297/ scgid0120/ BAI1-associated protein 3
MATFEKYRQRQKGQDSTLLLQSALVESKNNVLEPRVGNGSEIGPYFEDLASKIQEEELQTKRRKQERSESVQAAAPLLNLRRAYARANAKAEKSEGTTAGVDAEDEEEDDGEEDVPDSDLSRNPRDEPSVSGHALEVVYREALRVIVNRVGASDTSNAVASSDMYAHLQDVYRVGSDKHQELFGKEQAAEKPDFHVRVNVVAGQDLDSMDENGLSDPYCTLGLVHLSKELKDRRSDNKKLKMVTEMTDNVMSTTVQPKTLSPEWNEAFDFPVTDLKNMYLQVDLWDRDDDDSVGDAIKRGSSVKGIRGVGKFFQNLAEVVTTGTKDDFMGRCYVPLESIHQGGVDTWFPLESKRSKSVNGSLRLGMSFIRDSVQDSERVDPAWSPLKVYEVLYWDFVRHEVYRLQQNNVFRWRGRLPRVPTDILELFRVQASDLVTSMESFVNTTLQLLGKQRDIFPPNSTTSGMPAVRRLSNLLVSLSAVYKFKGFTNFFPKRNLQEDIQTTIRESTSKWLDQMEARAAQTTTGTVQTLQQLTAVVRDIRNDLVDAGHFYDHHYKNHLGLSYFAVVFTEVDRQICQRVSSTMAELASQESKWVPQTPDGQEVSTASFQLYIALQEVYAYVSQLENHDGLAESKLKDFHSWFVPFVHVWLSVAEIKAMDMVGKAVDLDRAVRAANNLEYGTMAVDVESIIKQLCQHYQRLDWPDEEERFSYMSRTYEHCLTVLAAFEKYVEDKLRDKGYYDTVGQFDISVELTITLNGLDHSTKILEGIPVDLGWQELAERVRSTKGNAVDDIERNMLDLYRESREKTRRRIIDQIGVRMSPDIQRKAEIFLKKLTDGCPVDESLDPLMVYLAENLKMLMKELISSTFMEIMQEIYRCAMSVFHQVVQRSNEGRVKAPNSSFYKSIQTALEVLVDFFESGDEGLNRDQLNIPEYLNAASYLELYCSDGAGLARHYYSDILQIQKTASKSFGSVSVALAFEERSETLHVEVLHAMDLPIMDLNGSSDPFFTLEVRPVQPSSKPVQKKTTVKDKTTTPLYDEKFFFPLTKKDQSLAGTVLMLTCYDWDRFTRNDIIGESFVAVSDIPVIASPDLFKTQYSKVSVPLLRPGTATGTAYRIMEGRTSFDADAAAFIADRTKLFDLMKADQKLGTSD